MLFPLNDIIADERTSRSLLSENAFATKGKSWRSSVPRELDFVICGNGIGEFYIADSGKLSALHINTSTTSSLYSYEKIIRRSVGCSRRIRRMVSEAYPKIGWIRLRHMLIGASDYSTRSSKVPEEHGMSQTVIGFSYPSAGCAG